MQAVVLCAGRGERLRPLTDQLPKPLVSDGRQALVDRHLSALARSGVRRVVINLGWLGERIIEHVGDGSRYGLVVVYSPEGYPTLDSGGALKRAVALLDDAPFWAVNADVWTDYAFSGAPEDLLGDLNATVGLTPKPDYRKRGDFSLIDDRAMNDGDTLMIFSGIACYRPAFFSECSDGRFSVVPMLREAAAQSRLGGFLLAERWFDIGTQARLDELRMMVASDG